MATGVSSASVRENTVQLAPCQGLTYSGMPLSGGMYEYRNKFTHRHKKLLRSYNNIKILLLYVLLYTYTNIIEVVHSKNTIQSSFTQPHDVQNLYAFLSSAEHRRNMKMLAIKQFWVPLTSVVFFYNGKGAKCV